MRLAVVTPEFPPHHIGGGGIAVEALAGEYAKNHEVRVFSACDSIRSWRSSRVAEIHQGVSVYRYPLIPIFRRQPYLRSVLPANPTASFLLSKDIKKWSPDVAHLHGYGYAVVDLAAFILFRQRVPYIFTVHGLPQTPYQRGGLIRAAYAGYQRLGAARTAARAHTVTAVSSAVADMLPVAPHVKVIPNGITYLPVSNDHRAARLRQKLDLDLGVPIIAAAGRLSRSKGFDVLVRSLRYIDNQKVTCVIAGSDGGELSNLRQLSALVPSGVKVLLPGWLDREQLSDLFRLASVVAVPSRDEPFGLVALEALGARRLVVASRIGGLSEFLRPPVAELVPSDDPHMWAAAITKALSRGRLTDEDEKAFERILAEHAWPHLASEYEDLLTSCLSNAVKMAPRVRSH